MYLIKAFSNLFYFLYKEKNDFESKTIIKTNNFINTTKNTTIKIIIFQLEI